MNDLDLDIEITSNIPSLRENHSSVEEMKILEKIIINNKKYYKCLCPCGNLENFERKQFKRRRFKKCNKCYKEYNKGENHPNFKNGIKIGDKINNFTVIEKISRNDKVAWLCRCNCGTLIPKYNTELLRGKSFSCSNCKAKKYKKILSRVGEKHHKLTILSINKDRKEYQKNYWNYLCDCGKITVISSSAIGRIKSCGCSKKGANKKINYKDYIGKKYGNFTILEDKIFKRSNGFDKVRFKCICDCGAIRFHGLENLKKIKKCNKCYTKLGASNPNYNPNISDYERENSKNRWLNPETKKWVKGVLTRDKYVCQITNKRGAVCAHHIESWDVNKERRFDVSNGITLLESVYNEFHKRYGYGENNRAQFENFIKSLTDSEIQSFSNKKQKRVLTPSEKNTIINYLYLICKFQISLKETNTASEKILNTNSKIMD